jgi:hypothetical protein
MDERPELQKAANAGSVIFHLSLQKIKCPSPNDRPLTRRREPHQPCEAPTPTHSQKALLETQTQKASLPSTHHLQPL